MNLPNIMTIARIFFLPIMIIGLYNGKPFMLGLVIFLGILAYMLDHLDGYIAKRYNLTSIFGTFFDPIVDKLIVLSIFFVYVDLGLIPLWMILLLMFREFLASGLREIGSLKGKTMGAKWHGKIKGDLQAILLIFGGVFLLTRSLNHAIIYGKEIIYYGTLVVVLFSLFSMFIYFWQNRDLFVE